MSQANVDGKNIVILLGAGASASFGRPPTKAFLEGFCRERLETKEKQFLGSLRLLRDVKDIEPIVEILDSLLSLESQSKERSLHDFFKQYKGLVKFAQKESWPQVLQGEHEWSEVVNLAGILETKITDYAFARFREKPRFSAKITDYYGRFFSLIKEFMTDSSEFEIFTTNYDSVIEEYCSQSGHILRYAVLEHTLNPKITPVHGENYILTKLHGSLNWVFNKQENRINVINVQFPVPPNHEVYGYNEFVLFGRKPTPEKKEYSALFERFKEKLATVNVCVVVGFAFRHREINEAITNSLQANKSLKLLIVSKTPKRALRGLIPEAKIRKEFLKKERILYVEGSFGADKTLTLLKEKLSSL